MCSSTFVKRENPVNSTSNRSVVVQQQQQQISSTNEIQNLNENKELEKQSQNKSKYLSIKRVTLLCICFSI